MKNFKKTLVTLCFSLLMVLSVSTIAQAKTTNLPTSTIYLYPNGSLHFYDPAVLDGFVIKDKLDGITGDISTKKPTALKSSDSSIAEAGYIKNDYGTYYLAIKAKKTGTVTISCKADGNTYKKKIILKKRKNGLKTLTINGTDIASKFNKSNVCVLSYNKYKNKKLSLKIAGKHSNYYYHLDSSWLDKCIGNVDKKHSTITATKFAKKNSFIALTNVGKGEVYYIYFK